MSDSKNIVFTFTLDAYDKPVFDFFGVPVEFMPQIVRQMNLFLWMRASSNSFNVERSEFAIKSGVTPERQLSLALKLKSS